jgi:hypothetical protein
MVRSASKPNVTAASCAAAAPLVIVSPRKSGLLAPTILSAATPWRDRFEFDTARFESSQPSQPSWSLSGDFRQSEKCRHFGRLAAKSPISSEEYRATRAEGRDFRGESPLDEFSISEILRLEGQRPVAFSRRPVRIRIHALQAYVTDVLKGTEMSPSALGVEKRKAAKVIRRHGGKFRICDVQGHAQRPEALPPDWQ